MRTAVLAVLLAALLLPAAAAAQSAPFQPLPQAPVETQAPTTTAPAAASDGGISSLQQTLLILAGVVLVVGIGIAIARDARAHAPVTERELRRAEEGSTPEHERPRADPKAKAAAKRARQARKKNRPVRK